MICLSDRDWNILFTYYFDEFIEYISIPANILLIITIITGIIATLAIICDYREGYFTNDFECLICDINISSQIYTTIECDGKLLNISDKRKPMAD